MPILLVTASGSFCDSLVPCSARGVVFLFFIALIGFSSPIVPLWRTLLCFVCVNSSSDSPSETASLISSDIDGFLSKMLKLIN
ncbi:unnamed protein product [Moneuplotes crassus]|uniref:Uncharacterized protein n=1 Tax=Euplotes crassus TaxID=5936 RepID=A0AAD1Y992_EUPCR|nr:unnamed protein product [Moneuplotes crassus]